MECEIFVVTGSGHGHLHPCMELCNHLASQNHHATLVIPFNLSSATIPSAFTQNPLIRNVQITGSSGPPLPGSDQLRQQAAQDLESHIAKRYEVSDLPRPLCAIVDFQMGWTKFVFWKFNIPVIGFFTFGACAAAMEWAAWKTQVGDLKVGELRLIPWLPIEMSLTYSDLKRKTGGPVGTGGRGPPKPGDRPPWVNEVEGSIALIFNTCDDLERPFITYMNIQMNMPVWGVGPLLPERYLKFNSSASQLLRDSEIREHKRQSNHTEEEIIHWLDSKPRGSVIYVGFGSEVGPTMEEYHQLSAAFEQSTRPFIWVIQPKSNGVGGDSKVGSRGLIIYGWAPQLLILSHPSTGGFLSHCGWNSTMEAIGCGVPILAWPIRGDQYYNAKLVVSYHKLGYRICEDLSEIVKKENIVVGIEKLMGDEEMHKRANILCAKFENGFPASSEVALEALGDFISMKTAE